MRYEPLYSNKKWPCVETLDVIRNNYEHIKFHAIRIVLS